MKDKSEKYDANNNSKLSRQKSHNFKHWNAPFLKNLDSYNDKPEDSLNNNYLSDDNKQKVGTLENIPDTLSNDNDFILQNKKTNQPKSYNNNEYTKDNSLEDIKKENLLEKTYSLSSIKLSSKSRYMLILRILIFFCLLIFIPLETISSRIVKQFEKVYIITYSSNIIQIHEIFNKLYFKIFSSFCSLAFADRDIIILYNVGLYMIIQPFKIIKVIIVTNTGYFLIVILRLIYKENRPYWELIGNSNVMCSYSYASPSLHLFMTAFYWTYLGIQFCFNYKDNMSRSQKFLVVLGIIIINLLNTLNLLINFQNYIYQLNNGLVISLVLVCIFVDLENKIHNFLLNTMKNVYKIRKYKIQSFLLMIFIFLFGTIIYNFMENDSLSLFISNIMTMPYCKKRSDLLVNLGMRATFYEICYVVGSLGAFWGTALTIEYNCNKWWNSPWKIKIFKVFVSVSIAAGLLLPFRFFNINNWVLMFIIACLKYFTVYYITFGIIPLLFDKVNLNVKDEQSVYTKSEVSKDLKTSRFTIFPIRESEAERETSILPGLPQNKNNTNLFKNSVLVKHLEPKDKDENLEFLIKSTPINTDL